MSRGWDRPYPVMVLAGTDDFMRDRELSRARRAANATGRRFVRLSEGDGDGLRAALSSAFIVSDPCILVLESGLPRRRGQTGSWTGEDAALVVAHHAEDDAADIAMVVAHAGDPPKEGFVRLVSDAIGKKRVLAWEAPKPWEAKEAASKFLRAEVARLGFRLGEDVADMTVRLAGTDRWLMTQEATKFAAALRADGREEVTRQDVAGLVAPFASEYRDDLVNAVAGGNAAAVVVALTKARSGAEGESPVAACGHLARTVARWLHAASALASNPSTSEEDLASRVGVKPYMLKTSILPPARRWGVPSLTRLLRDVVAAERGAKQGRANPWVMLEVALIRHCASATPAPR
ncbi:MAG: hypothetical protein EBT79_06390 [Actinobacteria bacterium]|nr:hypothetical protein [Actinomycetota bacterium]